MRQLVMLSITITKYKFTCFYYANSTNNEHFNVESFSCELVIVRATSTTASVSVGQAISVDVNYHRKEIFTLFVNCSILFIRI